MGRHDDEPRSPPLGTSLSPFPFIVRPVVRRFRTRRHARYVRLFVEDSPAYPLSPAPRGLHKPSSGWTTVALKNLRVAGVA